MRDLKGTAFTQVHAVQLFANTAASVASSWSSQAPPLQGDTACCHDVKEATFAPILLAPGSARLGAVWVIGDATGGALHVVEVVFPIAFKLRALPKFLVCCDSSEASGQTAFDDSRRLALHVSYRSPEQIPVLLRV